MVPLAGSVCAVVDFDAVGLVLNVATGMPKHLGENLAMIETRFDTKAKNRMSRLSST